MFIDQTAAVTATELEIKALPAAASAAHGSSLTEVLQRRPAEGAGIGETWRSAKHAQPQRISSSFNSPGVDVLTMRFSVMIPTHEPSHLLREAVLSVLEQAPMAADMQIAIIDDHSVRSDVRGIISSVTGHQRIEFHPSSSRLGLAGNWNRAIGLARGELVHILHQDDRIDKGFYHRIGRAFDIHPSIGMAFCRSRIVDAAGRHIKTNSRQAWHRGVLRDWLPRIAKRQRVQTPAVVVPRRIYKELGGYRSDLFQAVDWEMWVRIAAFREVWYEPQVLATFRRHDRSESSKLLQQGAVWSDLARAIMINARSLPVSMRDDVTNQSARWHAASALRTARGLIRLGKTDLARQSVEGARQILALCTNRSMALRMEQRIGRLRYPDHPPLLRVA